MKYKKKTNRLDKNEFFCLCVVVVKLLQRISIDTVRMARDLRVVHVYWSVVGNVERSLMAHALQETTPVLRHLLAQRIELKYVPELRFEMNERTRADRALALLDRMRAAKAFDMVDAEEARNAAFRRAAAMHAASQSANTTRIMTSSSATSSRVANASIDETTD